MAQAEQQATMEEAKTQAERDLENLDMPGQDDQSPTPDERQRRIDDIRTHAAENPHYRATVEELSPGLLKPQELDDGQAQRVRDLEKENLEDLRARARSEADVLESPEDTQSELLHIDDLDKRGREFNYQPGKSELEELRARTPGATPEDSRSEILDAEERKRDAENKEAAQEHTRRTMEREQREYMAGLMDGMELSNRTGAELGKDDFIVPRSIAQKYVEVEGKYYTKDTKNPRVMFEDKATSCARRRRIGAR
jgi:hypothetical protein